MIHKKSTKIIVIVIALIILMIPYFFGTHHESDAALGDLLPIWAIIPFVGMLLSIAFFPLILPEWWEKNLLYVAFFWGLVFLIPFAVSFGPYEAGFEFYEILVADYLPFIVLLWGLFAVSGGILLKGSLSGSTRVNIILLLIGGVIASWVGTTGASMLLIRPILRANAWREKKAHIVVFFIFIVSNIGGSLTPLGDPPLFLGFLRGVPFFWTMKLFPLFAFNIVVLLVVFYIIDRRYVKKELANGNAPIENENKEPISIKGAHNFIFLIMIVGAVILSGVLATNPAFIDSATGEALGLHLVYGVTLPFNNLIQIVIIIIAGILSVITTKNDIHEENHFSWGPIKEVASLFIGIFVTMIPALAILKARGASLGLTQPWEYFWSTGALSSFLDNAPTYLVFMTTAAAENASNGVVTSVGIIEPAILMAVSAGAVFMGANTYIGNAPNFMVKTIAEENGVKMPSFFGYITWSLRFLIPLFILDTIIFFLF